MMEEPREQQPTSPPPPQDAAFQQPAPAAQPPPPTQQIAPTSRSPIDTLGRVVRLLARRMLWAAEQVWRLIEPRLGWVILTGFLMGMIGVLSLLLVLPRLLAAQRPPADLRVAALTPAPAVEDFLRGQQTYDADLMWDSFSTELRETLEGREITRDALAERVETERQSGRRYSGYKYIGGVELGNRQAMYFYAVNVNSAQQQETISFVFTVGRDGKIVSVE